MNKTEKTLESILPKEHQSIRTTFKISEKTEEMVDLLTNGTQVTVKRLFEIALDIEQGGGLKIERRTEEESARTKRKTFVISNGIMSKIKILTKKYKFSSRDETVAFLVLLVVHNLAIMVEREKLENIMNELDVFESRISDMIGEFDNPEHPVINRLSIISTIASSLYNAIDNYLKKKTPINPEDFSQSC